MDKERIMAELAAIYKNRDIATDVPMKLHTSFRAGGPAAALVEPSGSDQLAATIKACKSAGIDYYLMGNGTNIIVSDEGFAGVIIKIGDRLSHISSEGDRLTAEAGALLSATAKFAAEAGLSGLEFASGIPGSIGGAVAMNAGAYGGELGDILEYADCLDEKGMVRRFSNEELRLSYRHSICQEQPIAVLSATFRLQPGERDAIRKTMQEYNRLRNEKQPVQWPSAGSVFKRPEGRFAGKLIEDAGLKGLKLGGARVSPMHAGFIINENNATAHDIIKLIELVRMTVYDHSGIMLQEEVKILGERMEPQ